MDERIITYDPEANAAYVYVGGQPGDTMGRKEGGETRRISKDVLFDINPDGVLVGIEILNASNYGVDKCPNVVTPDAPDVGVTAWGDLSGG